MTIGFFASGGTSFSTSANLSASADLFVFIGSIIPSLSAGALLPIVPNITKPFLIKKLVNSADNTIVTKILKGIVEIAGVLFSFVDKAWQDMLGILDHNYQLKVAEDIMHQQVLSAKKVGSKYKTMTRLLKRDWKEVKIAKEMMNKLIRCI